MPFCTMMYACPGLHDVRMPIFFIYEFTSFLFIVSGEGEMSFVMVIALFLFQLCLNFKLGEKIKHPYANI